MIDSVSVPGRSRLYLNGEDSRQDGTRDAHRPAVVQKLEEGVGSEEQLSDDEVCSCVHLLLEVPQVVLVAHSLGVTGGVTWRQTRVQTTEQRRPRLQTGEDGTSTEVNRKKRKMISAAGSGSWWCPGRGRHSPKLSALRQHTSDTHVEVLVKLRPDVFNQVHGVVEASLLFLPVRSHRVCGETRTSRLNEARCLFKTIFFKHHTHYVE